MKEKSPGCSAENTAGTQIPAAEPEVKPEKPPEHGGEKQQVCPGGVLWAQRPEKAVDGAQQVSQQAAVKKLSCGKLRGHHPNRRPSQPPGSLGSS